MKTVGIIQARMSSTRLPGKVLLKAVDKPLLMLMLERVARARQLDDIWVATSNHPSDKLLAEDVESIGFNVHRGSLSNVLNRFRETAKLAKADIIVRLTGDCPLHDPQIIDRVVAYFKNHSQKFDYVSNVLPPTYPDGLDTEVFSFEALDRACREASTQHELEHVTPYIRRKATMNGRTYNVTGSADFSHLRWTLDEPEDYELIRGVYSALYPRKPKFGWLDVVAWQSKNPTRFAINAKYFRNEGSNRG